MIRWIWVFLDRPAQRFDDCARFWSAVTGTQPSPRRGAHAEFLTLLPDPALFAAANIKMQAVTGLGGVHLDLDVDDIPSAVRIALDLGAELVANHTRYAVVRSPAGHCFCFTSSSAVTSPSAPATRAPDGTISRLARVCIDIGPADVDVETRFWTLLTGWTSSRTRRPEFARLHSDEQLPVQLLFQRLGENRPANAHVDLATDDIAATAARHERLGATVVQRHEHWIVLSDPSDAPYCVTASDPREV
ncbi:VOC family protein [Nocardia sp. CNY236]|uniref:VOC family protein n=1 Tax=Nocardia sp. CNY236 TaxID=1169152 RepID=UPI00048FFE84|nr:VOC family protein [Nocardia sp. CNY236]